MRDVERLESQCETLRTTNSSKGDNDVDLAKKILHLDRDFVQFNKEQRQEMHEVKQAVKDSDLILKNLRHQFE